MNDITIFTRNGTSSLCTPLPKINKIENYFEQMDKNQTIKGVLEFRIKF